ncbi:NUDIX hydrolase [Verrucomicrobia bacterium]|nr:NUDIX hydrolase [Verrucomicrobiota bacterium]
MKNAYGGVVIDLNGQVLLREPVDNHHGVAWTFAKGKAKPGETPKETALREVLEETGVRAKILAQLPGWFGGSRTSNEYFLMVPMEDTGSFDEETLAIRWVDENQAAELISQTKKAKRRARDLEVLEAAFAVFRALLFGAAEPSVSQAQLVPAFQG